MSSFDAFDGCLMGTAIGDALGLPCEALSPEKQRRRFGVINGHRLLFGRGMYSDDTEHTIMAAQALIASGGEVEVFRQTLARQLRGWILMLPGGVGLATLKACGKLLLGASPLKSGMFSAGNGPAMRRPCALRF
jgi:ADP-ribosyl-[dinitrogen reductase] hydrolase